MDTQRRYLSPHIKVFIENAFGRNILDSFMVSGWPGTELIGHVSRAYLINFSEEIQYKMIRLENRLFQWIDNNKPPLPEDLCLFKQGGLYPNLISVTHEKDAWLVSEKKIQFQEAHKTKLKLSDLLVFDGKYFCKT